MREIAYDTEHFSSRRVIVRQKKFNPVMPSPPITSDPPEHRLKRQLLLPMVSRDRLRAYEPMIREIADRLIDGFVDDGHCEFKAQFANAKGALFPNQFVNVRMVIDTLHDAIVVPTAAVQRNAQGANVVYVVKNDTVNVRPVTTGPTEGTNTALAITKQREAIASAGGEAQVQLAFATNLMNKRIIMIPSGSGINLQTLDLNKALESILRK